MALNETCVAMSDAIRSNATLQAVTFHAGYGYMVMDNETGVAMAHAIRGNATLEAFNFYAGDNVNMDRQHETSPGAGARRPVPGTAIVASPRTRAARSCASRTVGVGRTGPRHNLLDTADLDDSESLGAHLHEGCETLQLTVVASVSALCRDLDSPDPKVKRIALDAIGSMGRKAGQVAIAAVAICLEDEWGRLSAIFVALPMPQEVRCTNTDPHGLTTA